MGKQWRKQLEHETIQMGQKTSRRFPMVGKLFSEQNEPTRLFSFTEFFSTIPHHEAWSQLAIKS